MRRWILHSDINCCYAQAELQRRPELRGLPVVVGGDEELRHGIVLAKNLLAKRYGIGTAETLNSARKKCPGLVVIPPDMKYYDQITRDIRKIYYSYTDRVEGFGPDEAWMDITGSLNYFQMTPYEIAQEISERTKAEVGLSVSIGISWNKIFAKFGSDYKKPDAITLIDKDNYKKIIWESPVDELLYVGAATKDKLYSSGINTIGELAGASDYLLQKRLKKMGFVLRDFARGDDQTEVMRYDPSIEDVIRPVKSYSNGLTAPHDIIDYDSANALITLLSDSVSSRMREGKTRAKTLSISVRPADFTIPGYSRQTTLPIATNITREMATVALKILLQNQPLDADHPIRAIRICASNLVPITQEEQLLLFDPFPQRTKHEIIDSCVFDVRKRFGRKYVLWGAQTLDPSLYGHDPKEDNIIHPVSYFHR